MYSSAILHSTDNLVEPARDADALVIEATYAILEADVAREFGHLTARQAAELAVEANVRHLILQHISRRYTEREILDEARQSFPIPLWPGTWITFRSVAMRLWSKLKDSDAAANARIQSMDQGRQ